MPPDSVRIPADRSFLWRALDRYLRFLIGSGCATFADSTQWLSSAGLADSFELLAPSVPLALSIGLGMCETDCVVPDHRESVLAPPLISLKINAACPSCPSKALKPYGSRVVEREAG